MKLCLYLTLTLGYLLSCIAYAQQENLLRNSDFESRANKDGLPDGWAFSWQYTHSSDRSSDVVKRKPDYAWDADVHHSGTHSIRVGVRRAQDDGVWSAPPIERVKGTKIYLARAWIKTENIVNTSARVIAACDDANGKWLSASYTMIVADKSSDWKQYAGFIEVHPRTARIRVKAWVNFGYSGTGTAWFDEIELFPTALKDMPGIKYIDETPLPELSPRQKERGYVVFYKNYLEMVFPTTIPEQSEIQNTLSISAAPGEYEPVTFAVRALRDLKGVKVSAAPLKNPDDEHIPNNHISILPVKCLDKKGQARWGPFADGVMTVPVLLEDRERVDVPKDTTRQFWVTVQVPESAKPGRYSSKLSFVPENAPGSELNLRIKVLPIKLIEPNGIFFGMYSKFYDEPGYLERIYTDMRSHGMTTVGLCCGLRSKIEIVGSSVKVNFDGSGQLERAMQAYVKAEFPEPVLWLMGSDVLNWCRKQGDLHSEKFADCYEQVIRAIVARGKEMGWPEIIFQPLDEPFEHAKRLEDTKRCLQILKQIPGVRTEEDGPNGNPGALEELYPWCDILAYHDGPFLKRGAYDKQGWGKFLQRLEKDGKEMWFYNIDLTGYHPEVMRFGYGFGLFAAGGTGALEWSYQWPYRSSKPEAVYENVSSILFYYPTTEKETGGPTIGWEAIREGVDDYKYLYTLNRLIETAKESGNAEAVREAQRAEIEIQEMLSRIDFTELKGRAAQGGWTGRTEVLTTGEKVVSGSYKVQNGWTFADYDATRQAIAKWIVKLEKRNYPDRYMR